MVTGRLLAAAFLGIAGLAPLSAAAQSVTFPAQRSTVTNGSITVNLTVPSGGTGEQTLSVDFAGDFAGATEFAVVRIEGTDVGTLSTVSGSSSDCDTASETITIPDGVYTAAAADGTVTVVFDAGASPGNVDTSCGVTFPFSAPFTAFNGINSSFAVQGSLTTSPGAPVVASSAEAQQETIAATRGRLILQNSPSHTARIARLRGAGSGVTRGIRFDGIPLAADAPFALDVSRGKLDFAGDTGVGPLAVWAEGTVAFIDDAASDDQTFGILHAGIDTVIGDRLLLGLGLQLDRLDLTDTATGDGFDGTGWMIGPLLTYRVDENLFFDGRIAFGEVETDVARAGGGNDSYDSERTLVQLGLTGDLSRGRFTIAPRGELGWYRESSDPYNSVTLGPVGATEVTVRQALLGAQISHPLSRWGGVVTPYVDLGASYAEISGGAPVAGSFAEAIDGWSGQVRLGAAFAGGNGVTWSAEAGLGGIGTDADTFSANVTLDIPF